MPPTITTQPSNQTVTVGQTATFFVAATDTVPISYQWAKNGVAIPGATSTSYTTPATIIMDNSSQFTATVSNTAGTIKNSAASLTVNAVTSTITSVSVSCTLTAVLVTQTSQCSVTVQGTGNFSSSVTWSTSIGTINASGSFTAPATSGNAIVTATSTQDPTKSGTATITVNAAAVAPSITTQPASQTVTVGQTATFFVVATGTSPLNYQWAKSGSVIPGATSASYTTPVATIADNGSQFTVVVSNTAGTITSSAATLTVNYPVPAITSVSPTLFCSGGRECIIGGVSIAGSGFYPGCIVHTSPIFTDIVLASGTDLNHISVSYGFGANTWSPGTFTITVSCSLGQGGGTSNPGFLIFTGNENTLAVSPTQAFQLDQISGMVHAFDLASGSHLSDFNVDQTPGDLVVSVAVDDATGKILAGQEGNRVGIYNPGSGLGGVGIGQAVMGVAAKTHNVCVAEDQSNQISYFDISQFAVTLNSVAVAGKPWNVQMTQMGGKLVCVVQTIENPGLSMVSIPGGQLSGFLNFTGLTPASQTSVNGGWQLGIFEYNIGGGPLPVAPVRIAAILSRADQKVLFVDLSTNQISGPFPIAGDPFRIAVDNIHHTLIVALADPLTGGTKFVSMDPVTGVATPLTATSSLLAVGLGVSADGSKLYVSMRNQFVILPNQ